MNQGRKALIAVLRTTRVEFVAARCRVTKNAVCAHTVQATQSAFHAAKAGFEAAATAHAAHQSLADKLGRPEDNHRAKESSAALNAAMAAFTDAADNRDSAKAAFDQASAGLKEARGHYEAVMRPEGRES